MRIDPEQVREMAGYWDDRKRRRPAEYSENSRISHKLIEKAKPHVLHEFSKMGNDARKLLLPREKQLEIARKASKARAKLPKAIRSEISKRGWLKRARISK
jgi:hypothetical protein